jgi:hypothetical protein
MGSIEYGILTWREKGMIDGHTTSSIIILGHVIEYVLRDGLDIQCLDVLCGSREFITTGIVTVF